MAKKKHKKQKQQAQKDSMQEYISLLPIYEKIRKKALWEKLIIIFIFSVLSIYSLFAPIFQGNLKLYEDCTLLCLWTFFSFATVCAIFLLKIKDKEFRTILKKQYLARIISNFKNITWQTKEQKQQSIISDDVLEDSGLFSDFERKFEDEFSGVYNNVEYKISETTLRGKGLFSERKIFKGVVILFKFNKKINNRTIITSKSDKFILKNEPFYSLLAMFIFSYCFCITHDAPNWASLIIATVSSAIFFLVKRKCINKKGNFDKNTLEDCVFNKRFNVYSSDEVEARYLITPSFMERFYNLQTNFGTRKIKCSFCGDLLIIAISTKRNLFEFGSLFKSLYKYDFYAQIAKDINSILSIIDYFKLNENTKL